MVKAYRVLAIALVAIWMVSPTSPALRQPTNAAAPAFVEARAITVARDRAGHLWAVWETDDGSDVELYFNCRDEATGAWSMSQPVHRRPGAWDRSPSLVVAAASDTLWLAWSSAERTNPARTGLYVSRWGGQHWSDPEVVPVGDVTRAREPALAAGPDGSLWLAWVGFDGIDEEIFASHWDGASWSPAQQVNAPDEERVLYDRQPRLVVGHDGHPWLAWIGYQYGGDDEIYVSRWTGDRWTPEQRVSQDDDSLDVWPCLELDAQGQPWIAWTGLTSDAEPARLRILTARWDASHAAWTTEVMASSPPAFDINESYPALLSDHQGGMHLIWVASGDADSALAYARWTGEGWTAPQWVRAGVPEDRLVAISHDDTPAALWLAPVLGTQAPMVQTITSATMRPLATWATERTTTGEYGNSIPNRYLAFGDSITWGGYEDYPYPTLLENRLDAEFLPSRVINSGNTGEDTDQGVKRIGDEVRVHRPEYVLLMEGTNDISHLKPPSHIQFYLMYMIDKVRWTGIPDVTTILATLVPRLDDLNDQTALTNEIAIAPLAVQRGVPLCDQWQAFYDYGPWQTIYHDQLHPDQTGLQIVADTFYDCIMTDRDSTPPMAVLDPVPWYCECSNGVELSWSGTDPEPGAGVASYDVQVQIDYGVWTDWLLATTTTMGTYTDVAYAHVYSFRVRARDGAGNVGDYTAPSVATQITDNVPPYEAHVNQLPPARVAPFAVSWGGSDACADVTAYDVQYRVGTSGTWQGWLAATANTTSDFAPTTPQYGETYYFRARAQDAAGNWSAWSGDQEAYTKLARFTLSGHALTIRHEPVVGVAVSLTNALASELLLGGGYVAYVADAGNYNLSVNRYGFGPAKWMRDVPVSSTVTGLDFVLAPSDDVVSDGDFEAGDWGAWQPGGTLTPTSSAEPHTGYTATLLGGPGELSWLSQSLSVTDNLTNAALSFLVRLNDDADGSSTFHVELAGASISHTQVVTAGGWTHVWFPVDVTVGQALTLTFTLSDTPAIRLDEVSLGSAIHGGTVICLPIVARS